MRRAFDLGEFANRLARKGETRSLSNRMLSFLDASSAHADLVFAQELIHAFFTQDSDNDHIAAINAALISQIVLLYARATIVSSRPAKAVFAASSRRTFDVTRYMSSEEKIRHEEIKLLRNESVAHFNRDTHVRGVLWAKEKLIMVAARVFGESPKIGVVSTRLSFDQEIVTLLVEQVKVGLRVLGEIWNEIHQECWNAFIEYAEKYPEGAKQLEDLELDLRALFQTEEAYFDFIGEGKGVGKLHWNHRATDANGLLGRPPASS